MEKDKKDEPYWKMIELIDSVKNQATIQNDHFEKAFQELTESRLRIVSHFDDFEKIAHKTEESLKRNIEGITATIAKQAASQFNELIKERTSESLDKIYDASKRSSIVIEEMKQTFSRKQIIMILSFCLGSLLTSGLITWVVPKKTEQSMSPEMAKACQLGIRLKEAWPKISKKDQEKINKIIWG